MIIRCSVYGTLSVCLVIMDLTITKEVEVTASETQDLVDSPDSTQSLPLNIGENIDEMSDTKKRKIVR